MFQNHVAIVSKLRDLVLCNINSGLIKLAVGLVMTGRSRSLCLNSRLNESKTLKRVFSALVEFHSEFWQEPASV